MPNASYAYGRKVMQSAPVRARLAQVADRIAATARTLAATEGASVQVSREGGTRPRGRPYERVLMTAADEFGTAEKPRRRILGRAASSTARTGRPRSLR